MQCKNPEERGVDGKREGEDTKKKVPNSGGGSNALMLTFQLHPSEDCVGKKLYEMVDNVEARARILTVEKSKLSLEGAGPGNWKGKWIVVDQKDN